MAQITAPVSKPSIGERFASSWGLFKTSWRVVRSEPALFGLTILSLVARLAAFILLFLAVAAVFASAALSGFFAGDQASTAPLGIVFIGFSLVWGILLSAPISAYFSGAIAHVAMERIEGRDPSVGDGLSAASRRFGSLAVFGIWNGIVNALTSSMGGNRSGLVGQAISIAQAAARELYALLTSLALPVIMREQIGGTKAIGRSTEIVRAVWPQAIASGIGVRLVTSVINFALFVVMIGSAFLAMAGLPGNTIAPDGSTVVDTAEAGAALFALIPLFAIGITLVIIVGTVGNLLQAVFNGALYLYATTGKAGDFAPKDLAAAAVTSDGVVKPGAAKA